MRFIPFREMKLSLTVIQAEVALMLGSPGIEWKDTDYGLFLVMKEMKLVNPTRHMLLIHIGSWLRFYKRLIDSLPVDSPLYAAGHEEFDKVSAPYVELLEEIQA